MTRGQRLFVILNAIFVTFLLMAEITGGKLFQVDTETWPLLSLLGLGMLPMTMGVVPFPVTFLITDLLNEYYGKRLVRFTTMLGTVCIGCAYLIIIVGLQIPAASFSSVGDEAFEVVFASSGVIIVASVIAYMIGQLIDIQIFHWLRVWTRDRHIWLRATGSTIVSQFVDSFVVILLAFHYLAKQENVLPFDQCVTMAMTNFSYKLLIAIALTPVIYMGHAFFDRYLGAEGVALRKQALASLPAADLLASDGK